MKHWKWWIATGAFLIVSSALEMLSPEASHSDLLWHRLPAFDFAYGLVGCALIVVASKRLGKWFLQRPESYYQSEGPRSR